MHVSDFFEYKCSHTLMHVFVMWLKFTIYSIKHNSFSVDMLNKSPIIHILQSLNKASIIILVVAFEWFSISSYLGLYIPLKSSREKGWIFGKSFLMQFAKKCLLHIMQE